MEPAHLREVLRIQDECYVEIEPESRESLQAKLLASPGTCLVAATAAGVVAYLIAVPVRYPELPALNVPYFQVASDADTLYIHDLAVADTGRATGAGRALVRAALDAARARGLSRACLVAIQGSAPYWKQFGFEQTEARTTAVAAKLASYGAGARLMRTSLRE
jgi:predicted N-acetyltransferase YhbS